MWRAFPRGTRSVAVVADGLGDWCRAFKPLCSWISAPRVTATSAFFEFCGRTVCVLGGGRPGSSSTCSFQWVSDFVLCAPAQTLYRERRQASSAALSEFCLFEKCASLAVVKSRAIDDRRQRPGASLTLANGHSARNPVVARKPLRQHACASSLCGFSILRGHAMQGPLLGMSSASDQARVSSEHACWTRSLMVLGLRMPMRTILSLMLMIAQKIWRRG